jgi:hypothetical protein
VPEELLYEPRVGVAREQTPCGVPQRVKAQRPEPRGVARCLEATAYSGRVKAPAQT